MFLGFGSVCTIQNADFGHCHFPIAPRGDTEERRTITPSPLATELSPLFPKGIDNLTDGWIFYNHYMFNTKIRHTATAGGFFIISCSSWLWELFSEKALAGDWL